MATAKKSQYSRTKPKAGSAKNPISQVPPSMPPKEPSTDPNTPALREGISIEGEFVPFTVETYVSRLTEASEQNSPKTIFAKQIAENGGIAELAVQMAPSEGEGDAESQVLEATRRALLYREAEQYVLAELRESGDIKSGLLKCREAWERRKRHENPIAYTHKTDANGKPLPIALEEALRVLMPHDAKQRRLTYFQKWFADDCVRQLRAEIRACEKRADDENLNPREHTTAFAVSLAKRLELEDLLKDSRKLLIKSVEEKIHEMTKHGVDPRLFDRARLTFTDWKAAEVSKIKKASGTQGAKKKQKRVARPPAAAMKEILTPLLRKSKRDLT
jgi:hypothetical protein